MKFEQIEKGTMYKNKHLEELAKESATLVDSVNNNVAFCNKVMEKFPEFKNNPVSKVYANLMDDIFKLSTKLCEVQYFYKIYSTENEKLSQARQELG